MNRRFRIVDGSPGEAALRFSGPRVQAAILLATACRAELERLCERAGISHAGQSSAALRRALRQRLEQI